MTRDQLTELEQDIDRVLRKHGMEINGRVTLHLTGEETISRKLERSRLSEVREDWKVSVEFNAKILGEWSATREWRLRALP